jgi:hypothetical protein
MQHLLCGGILKMVMDNADSDHQQRDGEDQAYNDVIT